MLKIWKCNDCELHNSINKQKCQACFSIQQPSPLEQMMTKQTILFNGFVRIEILNHLSKQILTVPNDVINLCATFYILQVSELILDADIKIAKKEGENWRATDENVDSYLFQVICGDLIDHEDLFQAVELLKVLLQLGDSQYNAAEYHFQMACALAKWHSHKEELHDKVVIEFEAAIKIEDSRRDRYRYWYGVYLNKHKKYELALEQCLKAYELNSNDSFSASKCAECYDALKDRENAIKYLQLAIDTDPNNPGWYRTMALYLEDYMDFENADKYHQKAIEIDNGQHAKYLYTYARFLYRKVQDYKEAEKWLLKSLDVAEDDEIHKCGINGAYAFCLYLMGNYQKALKYIKIEMEIGDYINKYSCFNYGYFSHLVGNIEDAETGLQMTLKLIERQEDMNDIFDNMERIDLKGQEYIQRFIKMMDDKFSEFETKE